MLEAAGFGLAPTISTTSAVSDAILFFANVYSSEGATGRVIPPQSPAGFNRALALATALASAAHSVEVVSQVIT